MSGKKNAWEAGADSYTPSIPQYFSWINNTNEGSTEEHTCINLEFFRYLKETYGMQISIYAWDAGNFDGASDGFGDVNSAKFRSQYPDGYQNVVKKAAEMGIRLGLWGSPDGFGNTPEEEKERFDFYVHLCRDYHFGLFKMDGVCGYLRPEKADVFAKMLQECRKYCPDLIVLNHRLPLYQAEKYVTTYLWNGDESYVDVLSWNRKTAMHHREFMFQRGHTENLDRLAEDSGVCISSAIDYFEDELIYQAFNRSLILAPEMYGNPWLMRDEELARLARVYNLHRRNAALLVSGMLLPEEMGTHACSRGSGSKRFLATGNDSWETKKIAITLGAEIGITANEPLAVNLHHPYEKHLGIFASGDVVEVELMPFRATLIEISTVEEAEPMLKNCEYEMIKEAEDGTPIEVRILTSDGSDLLLWNKGKESFFGKSEAVDRREKAPVFLGTLDQAENAPANGELLYEAAVFAATNDSLESREIKRSGDTKIPQVQAARDAFFGQEYYQLRGCEAVNMFDGREDTFFDAQSKTYCGANHRVDGGCLRVDFGEELSCDTVEIEFFAADTPTREVEAQQLPLCAEISCDLANWTSVPLSKLRTTQEKYVVTVVKFTVHTPYDLPGKKMAAAYSVNGKIRYLRIENPVDRIYAIRLWKDGKELPLGNPHANNMQAHYKYKTTKQVKWGEFTLPAYKEGSKLCVALEGIHGNEAAYCVAEIDGVLTGFPERAPDYRANPWEHVVCSTEENNTYYLPLSASLEGKRIKIYTTFAEGDKTDVRCDVYLCEKHI